MTKAEIHYLKCQDDNCDLFACAARRDFQHQLDKALRHELMIDTKTRGQCSGRTEHIIGEKSNLSKELVWAVYEGAENLGYKDRKPVAWFKHHDDARAFILLVGKQLPI